MASKSRNPNKLSSAPSSAQSSAPCPSASSSGYRAARSVSHDAEEPMYVHSRMWSGQPMRIPFPFFSEVDDDQDAGAEHEGTSQSSYHNPRGQSSGGTDDQEVSKISWNAAYKWLCRDREEDPDDHENSRWLCRNQEDEAEASDISDEGEVDPQVVQNRASLTSQTSQDDDAASDVSSTDDIADDIAVLDRTRSIDHSRAGSDEEIDHRRGGSDEDVPDPNVMNRTRPSPSVGSKLHYQGRCKPCAFAWAEEGCQGGSQCKFCHVCPPGEKQRRKRNKRRIMRAQASQDMAVQRMVSRSNFTASWFGGNSSGPAWPMGWPMLPVSYPSWYGGASSHDDSY